MFSLLLAIIYMAFISLGLPDSLLGAAWPVMHLDMGVPVAFAGIVSMLIALGTIVSSLLSDRLTRRFGAGTVTAVSVLLTAAALLGFSLSSAFWMLCLWAIPYGLGAGAVDAALNNYVALHYASRHMNWLHCFWGVGAAVGPYIMGQALNSGAGFGAGYRLIGIIQLALTAVLFVSLPLWKRRDGDEPTTSTAHGLRDILHIRGVPMVLLTFFGYCALESTTGLWASTYLVQTRGVDAETAAAFASLFFLGITVGRFVCGFISDRLGDRFLIRIGLMTLTVGILLTALPTAWLPLAGLVVIGLGCAPIYPSIIHATPHNFGKDASQSVIGVQMASAYIGSTLMPPIFGWLSTLTGIGFFPFYLLIFAALMLFMSERLNRTVSKKEDFV